MVWIPTVGVALKTASDISGKEPLNPGRDSPAGGTHC